MFLYQIKFFYGIQIFTVGKDIGPNMKTTCIRNYPISFGCLGSFFIINNLKREEWKSFGCKFEPFLVPIIENYYYYYYC